MLTHLFHTARLYFLKHAKCFNSLLCDVFRNMGVLYWLPLHITCSYIIVWSWWDVQISKDKLASYLATTTEQDRGAGMFANEHWPNSFNHNNKACTPTLRLFLFALFDLLHYFLATLNYFFYNVKNDFLKKCISKLELCLLDIICFAQTHPDPQINPCKCHCLLF